MTIRFSVLNIVSVTALVGLTACGGGGGTLGSGIDLGVGPGSYADLDSENDRFVSFITSPESTSVTSPSNVVYNGIIVMGTDLDPGIGGDGDPTEPTGYIGQVQLTAVFSGPLSVTGSASNFFNTNIDASGNPGGTGSATTGTDTVWILTSSGHSGADFDLAVSGMVDGRSVSGNIDMVFKDSPAFVGTVDAIVGSTDPTARLLVTGADTTTFDAFLGAD